MECSVMQNPTAEEGAIIKRDWWKRWTHKSIPPVKYIMQSYDTAFLKAKLLTFQPYQLGVFLNLQKILLIV